jgi:predicted metal-binding transcription factor (methanogenesis marker protein 9)
MSWREELANELEKSLKELQKERLKEIEKKHSELRELTETWSRVIRALRGEVKLSEKEIRDLLCYNSLAYCCGLKKPCAYRDAARALLGITDEEYARLKEELDKKLHKVE